MLNNSQLVRRARRKWYRRLTEKCNMHDRHGGAGVDIAPVLVEMEEADVPAQSGSTLVSGGGEGGAVLLRVVTQNMRLLEPDEGFCENLGELMWDVLCLQEVTPSCVQGLLVVGRQHGFEVVSPLFRGRHSAEGFDVAILLKKDFFRKLRVSIVELGESGRCLLHVGVQVVQNGALVAIATAHLSASAEEQKARTTELGQALSALEEVPVDAMVLAGDLNMHADEKVERSMWQDAWVVAGAKQEDAGTWCPDHVAVDDDAVRKWRFDRVVFRAKGLSLQTAAVAQRSAEGVSGVSLQTTAEVAAGVSPRKEGRGLSLQAALASGAQSSVGAVEGVSLQTTATVAASVSPRKEGRGLPLQAALASGALSSVGSVEGVSLQTTAAVAAGASPTKEGRGLSLQAALASGVVDAMGGKGAEDVPLQAAAAASGFAVQRETLLLSEFNRIFDMFEGMDHATVAVDFWVVGGAVDSSELKEERLKVLQVGLGPKVAKRPGAKDSCVRKQHQQVYCGKDYEKPRMLPGRGCILEDPRRKALYRLYTRRNCHHMNTHDPLKAMGLVANVDDQVVLTVQAAVIYLTKYLGKLGGGHTASGRIGGLIDEIISKMQDTETMSVASLLSKLFIHAAVPEDICSLEAWHVLFDLPRVLSSRYIVTVNAKDEKATALKSLNEIQAGTQETIVSRPTKLEIYLERTTAKRSAELTNEMLQQMSYVQFVSQVDRRGQNMSLRKKANIVKEKPFLQFDPRRRDAADMARACLRLHRPFKTKGEDPLQLDDGTATQELEKFVKTERCPVWLRLRYAKHTRPRQKRKKKDEAAGDSGAVGGGLTLQSAAPLVSDIGVTLQSAERRNAAASHSTLALQSGDMQPGGSAGVDGVTLQSADSRNAPAS